MIVHRLRHLETFVRMQTGSQYAGVFIGSLLLPSAIIILVVAVRLLPASIDQTFS